jgi:hypothetical protein
MPKSRKSSSSKKSRRQSRLGSRAVIIVPKGISNARARRLVYNGKYLKTRGGLMKDDLVKNSSGRVVSKKKQEQGQKLQQQFPWQEQKKFVKRVEKVRSLSKKASKAKKARKLQIIQ